MLLLPRNLLASIKSVVATKTSLIATMEKNSKKPVITKINLIFIAFSEVSQINICFAKLDLIQYEHVIIIDNIPNDLMCYIISTIH